MLPGGEAAFKASQTWICLCPEIEEDWTKVSLGDRNPMKWWGPCVIQLLRLLSAVILSLFILCLGIIPGQIPLSAYVVIPMQHHQLPNHSLEMFYLLLLQLTPEIPVAERQ